MSARSSIKDGIASESLGWQKTRVKTIQEDNQSGVVTNYDGKAIMELHENYVAGPAGAFISDKRYEEK